MQTLTGGSGGRCSAETALGHLPRIWLEEGKASIDVVVTAAAAVALFGSGGLRMTGTTSVFPPGS